MQLSRTPIRLEAVGCSRLDQDDTSNVPFGSVFSDHIFVVDYRDGRWAEPAIVPYAPMSVPPALSALHYGQAVFEGLKAFRLADGDIALFRVRDNLWRCNRSAQRLAMPLIPEELFVEAVAELVRVDRRWVPSANGSSLYVRPLYFATDETLLVRPSNTYRFVIFTCPVGQYFAEPLRLAVEERYVRAFPKGTGATKAAGNYAGSLLAERLARERGFHSIVWLDGQTRTCVEECGLMNIFFVIDGTVVTPPLGGTILPGVTRDSTIVLLREMGVEVTERPVAIDEVLEASRSQTLSESFAVGTAATVVPIECMQYRGEDIRPPVRREGSVSARVLARLDAIRTGREPDRHGWLTRV